MSWSQTSSESSLSRRTEQLLHGSTAVAAIVALVLRLVLELSLTSDAAGAGRGVVRFFSYFTILSNILVALTCGLALSEGSSRLRAFFTQARVRAAAALYIAVTAGVYLALLRGTWEPVGAWLVADSLLHYVVPALYLLSWLAFAPRPQLVWTDALRWLAVPAAYLLWTLARGGLMHEYPYPFMNVATFGLAAVLRNSLVLCLLFVLLGLGLVALDRWLGSRRP